jgi:hypothetical protein
LAAGVHTDATLAVDEAVQAQLADAGCLGNGVLSLTNAIGN